jgi:hypothetical protein
MIKITVAAVVAALAGATLAGCSPSAPAQPLNARAQCRMALMRTNNAVLTDEELEVAEVVQTEPTILACSGEGLSATMFEVRCTDPLKAACSRALSLDEVSRLRVVKGAKR